MGVIVQGVNFLAKKLAESPYYSKAPDHPRVLTALYTPVIVALLVTSFLLAHYSWSTSLMWLGVGGFSWTLIEYYLHRFVFHAYDLQGHWKTLTSERHLAHHGKDGDNFILVPPLAVVIPSLIGFLVFFAITWNFSTSLLIESGLLVGYVSYEWVHYLSHQRSLSFSLGKFMRRYHLQHHFMNDQKHFGVTSPLWDVVFGTYHVQENSYAAAQKGSREKLILPNHVTTELALKTDFIKNVRNWESELLVQELAVEMKSIAMQQEFYSPVDSQQWEQRDNPF